MSRPLHIAYVCVDRGVPIGGHKGASLHVAELVRALGKTGAEVRVVAARVAPSPSTMLVDVPIIDLGGQKMARRTRETTLHAIDSESSRAGASEAAAVLLNQDVNRALERLHREWPIDVVYERYSLWSFAAVGFANVRRIPHLLEVNAPLPEEQKRYRELENGSLAAALERHLFASTNGILVPAKALVPYATARGAAEGVVHVVPNAADPARFRPKRRSQPRTTAPRQEFVVGFIGSLKPWHGLDDLARTFRRLHRKWDGYRLLVVGEGPMRVEIEEQLQAWGLGDVATFTGAADHDQVPKLLQQMDLAVAPYPRGAPNYFSPIKIFEYMAAGIPVVASNTGQIGELLTHRASGLLHKPGAIAEIADCIEELRLRPALAAKLARNARTILVRGYTWRRNAQRVLRHFREAKKALVAEASEAARPQPKPTQKTKAALSSATRRRKRKAATARKPLRRS